MKQQIFTESDLKFEFHSDWKVRKYDDHPFYKALSGVGLSAVDFVGINRQTEGLFLMEVKNYHNRSERENSRTLEKLIGRSPLLLKTLEEKIQETQEGIRAISQYLNQKWWYRTRFQLFDRPSFQNHLLKRDRLFWMKAAQISQNSLGKVQHILWLELPPKLEFKRKILQQQLTKRYSTTLPNSEIWSSDHFGASVVTRVSSTTS